MTHNEWVSLGLISANRVLSPFRYFMRGHFTDFKVVDNSFTGIGYAILGEKNAHGVTGHSQYLGYFDTQEQAEVVALTLRMVK